MTCETMLKPRQTLTERKTEIREAIAKLSASLVSGRVKAIVGPQGAIAFQGWAQADRGGISDACSYRLLMATGSALAKQQIAKAEMLAGRSVDRQVVNSGVHLHGSTWHGGHKGHHH